MKNIRMQLMLENTAKHLLVLSVAFVLWQWISRVVMSAKEDALGPIGTVLGLLVIACLSAYFAFSFTAVAKDLRWRLVGYATTFFLFLPFVLSAEVILALAIRWVPELQPLWWAIVASLFLGAILFDYLDLMRIGLDVASLEFFERTVTTRSEEMDFLLSEIRKGRSLKDANSLIGRALLAAGKRLQNDELKKDGIKLLRNPAAAQQEIDQMVATSLRPFSAHDAELAGQLDELVEGTTQARADTIIADSLARISERG